MRLKVTAGEFVTQEGGRRVAVPVGGEFEGTENQLKSNPDRLELVADEAIKTQPKRARKSSRKVSNEPDSASGRAADPDNESDRTTDSELD